MPPTGIVEAMARLRRRNLARRVAALVGFGAALLTGWLWRYAGEVARTSGWFSYARQTHLTDTYYVVADRQLEHQVVPLALIPIWTTVAVWLLGLPREDGAV